MDNNNDAFNSLGLDGVSLHDNNTSTPTEPTPISPADPEPTTPPKPASDSDENILNDLSDEETIDLFIEGIMIEKGVDAPTEEIKQDIKNDLKNQLLKEIDRSLIAELPDDKLEELNRMATTDGQIDPEIIANMIQEANLDVTDIVGVTMVRFRELYLGDKLAEANKELEA